MSSGFVFGCLSRFLARACSKAACGRWSWESWERSWICWILTWLEGCRTLGGWECRVAFDEVVFGGCREKYWKLSLDLLKKFRYEFGWRGCCQDLVQVTVACWALCGLLSYWLVIMVLHDIQLNPSSYYFYLDVGLKRQNEDLCWLFSFLLWKYNPILWGFKRNLRGNELMSSHVVMLDVGNTERVGCWTHRQSKCFRRSTAWGEVGCETRSSPKPYYSCRSSRVNVPLLTARGCGTVHHGWKIL